VTLFVIQTLFGWVGESAALIDALIGTSMVHQASSGPLREAS